MMPKNKVNGTITSQEQDSSGYKLNCKYAVSIAPRATLYLPWGVPGYSTVSKGPLSSSPFPYLL